MASQHPQIGTWYEDRSFSTIFEVVAIDDRADTVELQYANGDLGEIDLDEWAHNAFTIAAPPDDAITAYGMDDDEWDDDMPSQEFPFQSAERYNFANIPGIDDR